MKSLELTTPHIIATVGVPGAGKTQFAQQFAETFSSPLISRHYFDRLGSEDETSTNLSNLILRETMKTRQTIIYDGRLGKQVDRKALARYANNKGYRVLFVWVQTDANTSRKRSLKRMSADEYKKELKQFSQPHESEAFVVISGRHTYSTQAKTVLKFLADYSKPPIQSASHQAPTTKLVPERRRSTRLQAR